MPAFKVSSCAWIDLTSAGASAPRCSYSTASMRLEPTISRTADSAACVTASAGRRFSNRNARASFRLYCTEKRTSTMFSSCVSIAESRRPVACDALVEPISTVVVCVKLTVSFAWMGYGQRQPQPASTVWLYLPKVVTTAFWPSCTMKEPLNSHTTTTISSTSAAPTPTLRASGWKPPPPAGSPPFLAPPKNDESLRVKSRHISSRSGGPSWPWANRRPKTLRA